DSGWEAPTGEYVKWLDGQTGNYSPPPEKFTNLAATFDAIRSEDKLGIHLWLQPFAVGRESFRYAGTRNLHIQIPAEQNMSWGWTGMLTPPFVLPYENNLETVNLCPRLTSTQAYLSDLFTEMATKYKPEGYWIDFIDGMGTYCMAPHSHESVSFA